MPSAFYVYLPIACAVAALAASVFLLRRSEKHRTDRLYFGVAIAFAASAYFAMVFGLLAFVPGPGSAGPVQYAAQGHDAMKLFRFRSTLISVALLGIPLVALFDVVALAEANRSGRPGLKGCAALALQLLLFGTFTAASSVGRWFLTG